jgi:phosphate-selective porin OprO/OprP
VKELRARIEALEQRGGQPAGPGGGAAAAPAPGGPQSGEERQQYNPRLALTADWDNGLLLQTANKDFRFHVGGAFEFDNAWYHIDNNLLFGNTSNTSPHDGSDMRRLRLRADGAVYEWIEFVVEVDMVTVQEFGTSANTKVDLGSVGLSDVYLTFKEVPLLGNVRVGHLLDPIGLDRLTNPYFYPYMEKSPGYDAFYTPFEWSNGVMVFDAYLDQRVTTAASVSRGGALTVPPFGFEAGPGLYAFTARATALPVYEDGGRTLLHVGAGYSHRGLDQQSVILGTRPLVRGGGGRSEVPNVLQTDNFFTTEGENLLDLELAMVRGPLSVSAEYQLSWFPNSFGAFDGVHYTDPRGALTYHGAYVEAGYFLTPGDYRRYNKERGLWDRPVPQENALPNRDRDGHLCWGGGAVQLLLRYSYLDLDSGRPRLSSGPGARAGLEHTLTAGLAWYLNPETSVLVNYLWTWVDSLQPGASGSFQGLGCRLHFDF